MKFFDDSDWKALNEKETNKDYEDIEEFTGFIPRYLPDKIKKVRYVFETSCDHLNLIFIHYYTTYQEREKFLEKKEEIKEAKKEEEKIENKNEIIDESDKNKDKEIEDNDEDNERKKIYFRSKIEDNEDKFCTKLIKLRRETQIGHPKYLFKGLESEIGNPTIWDGENYTQYKQRRVNLLAKESEVEIFIFNIGKIFTRGDVQFNFHSYKETLGSSFADVLAGFDDLVICMEIGRASCRERV